jgi:predicted aminopeptidase
VNISSIPRRLGATALAAMLVLPLAGCYELQAVGGQLSLLWKRKPITAVIADPATPRALRVQLQEVSAIRDFASRALGLPDNGSYRGYTDIGRDEVVWNVYAAPQLSVEPRRWCFPVVGCVAYRGYFSEREARSYAAQLRAGGYDVSVRGATAYSTLGYFDDPILNTMMGWSDADLAAIIFHELTHQMLYVRDDASFNEALASLIEEEGVRRWLLAHGRDQDLAAYTLREARYAQVTGLLLETRRQLQALFASKLDRPAMLAGKSTVFGSLRQQYRELSAGWDGSRGYDSWFEGSLNNADLVSIATYQSCMPGLRRELAAVQGELPAFYRRAKVLARMPAAERDALICAEPVTRP